MPTLASGSLFGNIGVSAYTYGDTLEETQSELHTGLTVRLRDGSGLLCDVSARRREPLTSDPEGDWNLYSTYLGWASRGQQLKATAGRRLMFVGVIRGFQDGLGLELRRIHRPSGLNFTIFAGQPAARGLDAELASDEEHAFVGLAAGARPLPELDVLLSSRIDVEGGDDGASPDLVGLLVGWRPRPSISLDGNLDYDVTNERSERTFLNMGFTFSGLTWSAEYFRMESPWIPETSWFSRFRELVEPRTQYRLALDGEVPSLEWLTGGAYWIADSEEEQSISAYLTGWDLLTVGYHFSGDDDLGHGGFYGNLRRRLSPALRLDAGVDLSRLKVYDLYDLPSYGSHLRLRYDPRGAFHVYSEVQHRKDRVMDSDVRLYVGAGYRFRRSYGGSFAQGAIR
jgi:hypothetical protein